ACISRGRPARTCTFLRRYSGGGHTKMRGRIQKPVLPVEMYMDVRPCYCCTRLSRFFTQLALFDCSVDSSGCCVRVYVCHAPQMPGIPVFAANPPAKFPEVRLIVPINQRKPHG
ncbi:unnamed protein product, partial [Ectocarpus sp. 8 AP-2014]